ncbi:cryptococcal mannosyltransferase 1-domain-containing protein [Xylariaceae sp. FL0016]|nr:cryptococcal mannosyltransferase 1-domain-containing protein [Xylariaceae sp. FL0016]
MRSWGAKAHPSISHLAPGVGHPGTVPNSRHHNVLQIWSQRRIRKFRRVLRNQPTKSILALLKYTLASVLVLLVVVPVSSPSYTQPPPHYRALESRCRGRFPNPGCANPHQEKVFISISLYDPTGELAGGRWGRDLRELIHLIGDNNVFLSIYMNDSGPEGTVGLSKLNKGLRCNSTLVDDEHVPLNIFPSLTLPNGSKRIKRLTYLSEMRNRALRPLDRMESGHDVERYDKVLFMNDVVFDPFDVAQLLFSTNLGEDGRTHYLSACALDYHTPFLFYDLYAIRDAEGHSAGLPIFPIFSGAGQGASRAAMIAQQDAVPVKSCWSGMVAMEAKHLQNLNKTMPYPGFRDIGNHVINPSKPKPIIAPVRFRNEPELFFDACECCLFQADVAAVARNQHAKDVGIFVNPYVRVAYKYNVLSWLPWVKRVERLFILPHAIGTLLASLPTRNPHRTVKPGQGFLEEIWVGDGPLGRWETVPRIGRNGMFCGVREFQTLLLDGRDGDINWENIKIPAGQKMVFPT